MLYKRILLKMSGELLMGERDYGIDVNFVHDLARNIAAIHDKGVEIALVIGGGNIFRGMKAASRGMDRASADYMGMLATVMNAIALQDALEKHGSSVRVCSALDIKEVAENFIRGRAERHLEKGRIVILTAGTGNPYFTTDTAAALRACELHCDVVLKATKVDGVYDKDPAEYPDAKKYTHVSYNDALALDLKVMDASAIALCRDNKVPIRVFEIRNRGENLLQVLEDASLGTLVS